MVDESNGYEWEIFNYQYEHGNAIDYDNAVRYLCVYFAVFMKWLVNFYTDDMRILNLRISDYASVIPYYPPN